MARSNSSSALILLDRLALGGLAVGLMLYVMPYWRSGRLAAAFWTTFAAALLHTYTSHARSRQGDG